MIEYYVDPNFSGSTRNGNASTPWQSLTDTITNIPWTAINSSLVSDDVTVYFTARAAVSDVSVTVTSPVLLARTDSSSHRITLDGMSRYNTNVGSPSWSVYSGTKRFKINLSGGTCALGSNADVDDTSMTQNYTTLRGFEVTGSGARVRWRGSHTVVEYIWSHDITTLDPQMLFGPATNAACTDLGKCDDVTIRNNLFERGTGEALYVAGNYIRVVDGGCVTYGNTHSNILIEDNTITDPGANGAQGDGIDLKAGLTNVTIRGNLIQTTDGGTIMNSGGARGIVSSGLPSTASAGGFLIENNILLDAGGGMSIQQNNGPVIRNNVFRGCSLVTDYFDQRNKSIVIYTNSLYNGVISMIGQDGATIRNNIITGPAITSSVEQIGAHDAPTSIDSDYNCLTTQGIFGNVSEGAHSIYLSNSTALFTGQSTGDFTLLTGVAPIDAGTDLSSTGFADDLVGTARPQGAAWDMGAYEYAASGPTRRLILVLS